MSAKDKPENEKFGIDRPLECGECKKPIAVKYTEIIGDVLTKTYMCADCPVLQRKLLGGQKVSHPHQIEGGEALTCGNCGTTLDAVRMGASLGCNVCYDVFDEVILAELQSLKKLPPRINLAKRSAPVHLGRAPGETREINPALRLLALNEALSETLKREDYEQAAMLRDQIKALSNDEKKGESPKKGNGGKKGGKNGGERE